jgi:hypothetical protein
VKRIRMAVGGIAINTPNYKSVSFPKFAEYWLLLWITIQFIYNFPLIRLPCRACVCFYWVHHIFPILSVILTKYHYVYNINWLPRDTISDMKFIIFISNLNEISPSVFSWKKEYIKNYDAILLSKYDLAEKRY